MKKCIPKWKKIIENKHWTNWLIYFIFLTYILISALVLMVLVGVKTIDWNWLTGYGLGILVMILAVYLFNLAINKLLKTENYFLYYFFYTLRIGIYVTPFLLAFAIPANVFSWVGILLGLVPIVFLPFFKGWMMQRQEIKIKKVNHLS